MRRAVALGVTVGAWLVAGTAAAPAEPGLATALMGAMNGARASAGLSAVRASPALRAAAAAHTAEMIDLGYFGHESSAGSLLQRMPRSYHQVGEILFEGTGPVDAGSVVAAWLASPEHRAILLGNSWRDVGVSADTVATGEGTEVVVTVDFGSRS
jgi:uncharacterized protein YkwD